ncbi:hypothetical protein RIF29_30322 [Crotalaria pallida]|uniref:Uncharacterized protein n=1 Tax=Crotalaria pallida TaxID=3830 RepID=A0AAN9EGA4_CROPI
MYYDAAKSIQEKEVVVEHVEKRLTNGDASTTSVLTGTMPANPSEQEQEDGNHAKLEGIDSDKSHAGPDMSRAHDGTKGVGTTMEKLAPIVDRIIKRGPGKRSRQEGKHATPTHNLLLNFGVKDLCKDSATHIENTTRQVVIQPGNFRASVPKLVKGTTLGGSSDVNGVHGWEKNGMEVVPESQFAIDPGQVGQNDISMKG